VDAGRARCNGNGSTHAAPLDLRRGRFASPATSACTRSERAPAQAQLTAPPRQGPSSSAPRRPAPWGPAGDHRDIYRPIDRPRGRGI